MRAKCLVLLLLGSLCLLMLLSLPLPLGLARADEMGVQVDNSNANEIATGKVVQSDPSSAQVDVSNNYHFWTAVDLQSAVGAASLRHGNLLEGGLWAAGGLIPPNSHASWAGTFDAKEGSSQSVFVHYDLATAGGSAALAGTVLSIVADTFGDTLTAGSPEALKLAVAGITQSSDWQGFIDVLAKPAEHSSILEAVPALLKLIETPSGRAELQTSLAKLGVQVTDKQIQRLNTVQNLLGFAETIRDLIRADVNGHTSGVVNFYTQGTQETASSAQTSTTSQPTTTTEGQPTTTEVASTKTSAPPPITKSEIKHLMTIAWGVPSDQITIASYANFGTWSVAEVWNFGQPPETFAEYFHWSSGSWRLSWDGSVYYDDSGRNPKTSSPPSSIPQELIKWSASHSQGGE